VYFSLKLTDFSNFKCEGKDLSFFVFFLWPRVSAKTKVLKCAVGFDWLLTFGNMKSWAF
jgi:hypothetical protein